MLLSLYGTLLFIHKRKWYSVNLSYRKICSNMCMMLPIGIKFLGIQLSSSFITNVLYCLFRFDVRTFYCS